MQHKPPQYADRLLRLFLAPHRREEVLGDLHEEFAWQVRNAGKRRARWRYWLDVLGFLKPWAIRRSEHEENRTVFSTTNFLSPAMLRNYFRTAWRNLLKNRFYSLINMSGLTIGLAVGILILLWVQDELSFDRFHQQASQIYKLENWAGTGSSRQIWTSTVAPIAEMGKQELPDIREAVRTSYNGMYNLFKYKDKSIVEENTMFTDPTLFSVFDFPLIAGNSASPFPDDHSIVLTETTQPVRQ